MTMSTTKAMHWLLLAYCVIANSVSASDGVLDIIPRDAVAAIAIRNLEAVQEKGDKLFTDAEIKMDFRPSEIFRQGYGFLGVDRSVDKQGSAALVLAASDQPVKADLDLLNQLVAVIPYRDLDAMAADLGFAKGELKPETLTKGRGKPPLFKHFYAREGHLYLGVTEAAIKKAAAADTLRQAFSDEQLALVEKGDLLMHIKPSRLDIEWEKSLDRAAEEFRAGADPAERELIDDLIKTLRCIESDTMAFYLEEGLRLENVAVFDPSNDEAAKKLLARLANEPGVSTLGGLPKGNILAAHAVRGDGSTNASIVRVLLKLIVPRLDSMAPALKFANRPTFFGVFTEIWQRLNGSRLAIYMNEDEAQHGLLSAVAILDTENPDEFVQEMRKLADLAAVADPDAKDPKAITAEEIEALVRELGSAKFAARRSANTKLALIGEAALPHLKKAVDDKDPEVSERSRALVAQITKESDERRKRLLTQQPLERLEPKFAYAAPRKDDATGAHIMQLKLGDNQAEAEKQLAQLFGPQWRNVRLVTAKKHIVVLFGSDLNLLQAAVRNLAEGNPGAIEERVLATKGDSRRDRKIQLHLSVAKATQLLGDRKRGPAAAPPMPDDPLSSLGLSIKPDAVEIQVLLPPKELKAAHESSFLW